MTLANRNKQIQIEYAQTEREMKDKLAALKKQVQPPCEACLYDGVYRCEACAENFYEGFNIKEYPGPQRIGKRTIQERKAIDKERYDMEYEVT